MALFHKATVSPTKAEMLATWVPAQAWCSADPANPGAEATVIGAFRFDDPEGQVGIETFLVGVNHVVFHVPITYRPEPLEGAEEALITEMHHTALGTRWVYDGVHDHCYLTMVAAVAMTGQGEALGMVQYDGKWHVAPANVRIQGGGWTDERASVHGFEPVNADGDIATFANERFDLAIYRRPSPAPRQPLALTATWDGQPEGSLLAAVVQR